MAAQTKIEGRYLGGRPPYGYRLADAGPHPHPAKAADGRRQHVLALDPDTAPVVQRIFTLFLDGVGLYLVAKTLNSDGVVPPSGADPARNRHRAGTAWGKSAIRAILVNPRYTGYQVWNKQHKAQVPLDANDVELGHKTRMRWNNPDTWVWSDQPAHPPIVSRETFVAAQERLLSPPTRKQTGQRVKGQPAHLLQGILRHEECGLRMQARRSHGHVYYWCGYFNEYAPAEAVDHPVNVRVCEGAIVTQVDAWLATVLDSVGQVKIGLARSAGPEDARLRSIIAECDQKLAYYRAVIEAGAQASLVARWVNEVEARRREAIEALERQAPGPQAEQPAAAIDCQDMASKAGIYRKIGLRLSYSRVTNRITAQLDSCSLTTRLTLATVGHDAPDSSLTTASEGP
ncbi:recombinase family protein [Frankia nepalensis]|uniref:Recombinase family protein n=1 Tax=Frankia nepalensis TaxID=1836974 RepID=A0A937R6H1_9ACTN|nr:recombinase family protein [Frankia nepalensis]MBL7626151.1 recombinase family protein [Frankia nepalensis]